MRNEEKRGGKIRQENEADVERDGKLGKKLGEIKRGTSGVIRREMRKIMEKYGGALKNMGK